MAVSSADTAINLFDQFCRDAAHNRVRRNILRDHGSGSDDRPLPHSNPVGDHRTRTQPHIIFYDNALCGNTLVNKRLVGIVKDMVDRNDLRKGRRVNTVTDLYTALPADDRIFSHQAVASDLDARLRHPAKIINMQDRPMHHDGTIADLNSAGTGMQIRALIEIDAMSQFDMIRVAQPNAILDGSGAIHFQDQPVHNSTNGNPNNSWDPSEQHQEELLVKIPDDRGCLTAQIELNSRQHGFVGPDRWRAPPFRHGVGSKHLVGNIDWQVVYNKSMFPAVFLDRDGVLIENRADYVRDWSQVELLPDAIAALSRFQNTKYKIVLITNQSAVGRGLMTLKTAEDINQRLARVVEEQGGKLDAIYMCPHAPEEHCTCRKPQAGLFLQAARDLSLDLASSWMIGDAWTDLLAGQNAHLRGVILVKTGRGMDQLQLAVPEFLGRHHVADDLSAALDSIPRG